MAGTREERPDPGVYLRQMWPYRWLLLAVVVAIPAVVYVVSSLLPNAYEARAIVQAPSGRAAIRAAELLETRPVADEVAAALGGDPGELLDQISVERTRVAPEPDPRRDDDRPTPQLFDLTARDDDPSRAAEVANAFAGVERAPGLERSRLHTEVVERAVPPASPAFPKPGRYAAAALAFSLLLAGGLALVLRALDRRVRTPAQVDGIAGAAVVGTIPESALSATPAPPDAAEPFQTLRASLAYRGDRGREPDSATVVGAGPETGATTVAVNLAIAFAEVDRNVILVDANLRRPAVAERLGIAPRFGLEDVLAGTAPLDAALTDAEVDTESGRLRVLAAGAPPASPAALLSSERIPPLLRTIDEQADLVIVDAAPLVAVGDALPLIAHSSGTLLVARLDRTRRDAASHAAELIAACGTLLGIVVTGTGTSPFEDGSRG